MWSFEGEYKRKPKQSFVGRSKPIDRQSFLTKIKTEREGREVSSQSTPHPTIWNNLLIGITLEKRTSWESSRKGDFENPIFFCMQENCSDSITYDLLLQFARRLEASVLTVQCWWRAVLWRRRIHDDMRSTCSCLMTESQSLSSESSARIITLFSIFYREDKDASNAVIPNRPWADDP